MDSETGRRSLTSTLAGQNILVTRPEHTNCGLITGLNTAGASVLHWPLIETVPVAFDEDQQFYDAIFFTSQQAVHSFFKQFPNKDKSLSCELFAVGSETATALQSYTAHLVHVPPVFDSLQAAKYWLEQGQWKTGHHILWPCGNLPNPTLNEWARQNRVTLISLTVYHTQPVKLTTDQKKAFSTDAKNAQIWVFTSPSAIDVCLELLQEAPRQQTLIACMGGRTAEYARQRFSRCDIVAYPNTLIGLVDAIKYHIMTTRKKD